MAGMIDESGDYISRKFLMKISFFLSLIAGILLFIILIGLIWKTICCNYFNF